MAKRDRLWEFGAYKMAREEFDLAMRDSDAMMKDPRGKALGTHLIVSADSICANMEEGFGRGTKREYAQYLRIARGSARETKGRYERCERWLASDIIVERTARLDRIIAILVQTIRTLRNSTDGG